MALRWCVLPVAAAILTVAWTAPAWTQRAPAPSPAIASGATTVGAQACAPCHQQIHDAWRAGRHSKMLQPATPASVVGDFSQARVDLHGQHYELRAANGEYFVTESYLTGRPQEHRVQYTLGSRRIQHYLTTIDHGRIIVLPPSWDVQRREWFDNVDIVRPDENDAKLVQQWNKNCVGCHVSRQQNNYSPATRQYATTWRDFGTSCERCHGPGSAHVQQFWRDDNRGSDAGRAIVRPTRLTPAANSTVCAQCHSLRDVVAPDFRPGENYYDYFVPLLEFGPRKAQDPTYWADGRPRRFSNDAIGLWQSECFLRGGATCTTCHDGHRPDVDRHAQLAPTNNALCARCHQQIESQLTTHTRHRAGGAGSSCVECHMPKTVASIKSTMRDHSMSLPTPENTVAFGIPNACTECHADRKASWAVDVLKKWSPVGRRAKFIERAETFTAARKGRSEAVERLLRIAADATQGPLIQANAVGYLRNYPADRVEAALIAASRTDQAPVRVVAAASLGQLKPVGTAGRAALLALLDDPQRAVRVSALVALVNIVEGPLSPDDAKRFGRVSDEYAAQASLHEDDATSQSDLGLVRLLNGQFESAARALSISLDLQPDQMKAAFLLGLTRAGQGRLDDARASLRRVPSSSPYYAAAQERLKALASR